MENDEYLTIKEVAKLLKIAPATVYRMVRIGKLPAIKLGKSWRFSRNKLETLFK